MSVTGSKRSAPHTTEEGAAPSAEISPLKRARMDTGAALAEHLSGEEITRILESKGPIVSLVILHANGKSEERTVDMTPKLAMATKILGGVPTFIGQYPEFEIVVMKSKKPAADAPANSHALPFPLNNHKTQGDILLVKINQNAIPESFTLTEWNTLQPEIEKACRAAVERGDLVLPEEEDEEDAEPKLTEVQEALLEHIITQFQAAQGRDPTEEEITVIMSRLNELSQIPAPGTGTAAMLGAINEEEDSEDDEYDPATDKEALAALAEDKAEEEAGNAQATKTIDAPAAKPAPAPTDE